MTTVIPGSPEALTLDDVVARMPEWRGRALGVRPLTNGLTNTNYRVDVGRDAYVVRIPGASTDLLAIDRENELHNTGVAARAGVGPRIVRHFPDTGVTVLEWIHGPTMTIEALAAPDMPVRVARSIRLLHDGPRFLRDFSMFRLLDGYLALAAARGIALPERFPARLPALRRVEAALAARPLPAVPCHNDLLPDNFIDDGRLLRIVDYEYSGNGDPTFELGNACQELLWDDARIAALCHAYFGAATAERLARVKLNMIVSDLGWTAWAAIQARISRLAFDFDAYGQGRLARAEAKLDSPDFPAWLEVAERGGTP